MKQFFSKAVLLLVSVAIFSSCSSQNTPKDEYTTTASGLKYKMTQEGSGVQAEKGTKVKVHYTGKLEDGTVFDSSVERGQPIEFELGIGRVIKGWDEGIALLKEGGKATFIIPANLGYGARAQRSIPANSTLIFDVELIKVTAPVKIEAFDCAEKDTVETRSGLKYIVVAEGEGKAPKFKSNVSVHYSGYLENGQMFDSSVKRGAPFQFPLGLGRVIKGWDEGVALMKEGSKYRLIIPYYLAYGENGQGPIPPKATLIFDVELLKVEDKK